MRVCGAQRILGRAAVHGAVELSWHSLQNQLLALPLRAAIQQAPPHSRPGEQGLWEHLVLSPPHPGGKEEREEERSVQIKGVGEGLLISDNTNGYGRKQQLKRNEAEPLATAPFTSTPCL